MELIDKIENPYEINLDWFYHGTYYESQKYKAILSEGIKCNYLLNKPYVGKYNGKYYVSLAKVTIPDNMTFLYYIDDDYPSFIIDGINPIKCEYDDVYLKYIETKDPRRVGNYDYEYQYYYWIKKEYIKGIVFNLHKYLFSEYYHNIKKINLENLLELCNLLAELNLDLPILDYSRRENTIVHEINKEKLKSYAKQII